MSMYRTAPVTEGKRRNSRERSSARGSPVETETDLVVVLPSAQLLGRDGKRTRLVDGAPHGIVEVGVAGRFLHPHPRHQTALFDDDPELHHELILLFHPEGGNGPVRPDLLVQPPKVGKVLRRDPGGSGGAGEARRRGRRGTLRLGGYRGQVDPAADLFPNLPDRLSGSLLPPNRHYCLPELLRGNLLLAHLLYALGEFFFVWSLLGLAFLLLLRRQGRRGRRFLLLHGLRRGRGGKRLSPDQVHHRHGEEPGGRGEET
jgi:hypothetical protein